MRSLLVMGAVALAVVIGYDQYQKRRG